jgi:hypothetical protein
VLPVSDLEQAPRADDLNAVLRGHTRGVAVVGNEDAVQPAPDDDRDGLCLAEMLSRLVPGARELVAEHANILVLSLVREERVAEDRSRPVQCS